MRLRAAFPRLSVQSDLDRWKEQERSMPMSAGCILTCPDLMETPSPQKPPPGFLSCCLSCSLSFCRGPVFEHRARCGSFASRGAVPGTFRGKEISQPVAAAPTSAAGIAVTFSGASGAIANQAFARDGVTISR